MMHSTHGPPHAVSSHLEISGNGAANFSAGTSNALGGLGYIGFAGGASTLVLACGGFATALSGAA